MTPINWLALGFSISLTIALYFAGSAYLNARDRVTVLEHEQEIAELVYKAKEDKELAVAALRKKYDRLTSVNTATNQEIVNALTTELMSAREDALREPISFGDDLIRNLIYTDCVWSLNDDSLQGRDTCNREAVNANPSSTHLSYSVITPTFLAGWRDACRDWGDIGQDAELTIDEAKQEWAVEYGNFDVGMCDQTLVALTPEASKFIEIFVNKGTDYITRLRTYAHEQADIIDQLTKRMEKAPAKQ